MTHFIALDDDSYELTKKLSLQANEPENLIIAKALRQFFYQTEGAKTPVNILNKCDSEQTQYPESDIAKLPALTIITGIEPFITGNTPSTNLQVINIRAEEGI